MHLINTPNINEARKQIQNLKKENKKVIVKAQDEDFNRKILEIKGVDVLLSPELNGKDKLKQRGSGLNEVLCKIAKQNSIKIGIDLDEIKKTNPKQKAILLGRISQNMKLCKRAKTDILFLPPVSRQEANSFISILTL